MKIFLATWDVQCALYTSKIDCSMGVIELQEMYTRELLVIEDWDLKVATISKRFFDDDLLID